MLIVYVFILVASLIGLSITINIYKQKHEKRPLVCPFGADCHSVVTSQFSSFLGIGLEVYGAMYYGATILVYGAFILFPALVTPWSVFFVLGATIGAFLFSLYLTFVQAVYIKSWCSWCLMSAGVSTAIFLFSMIGISLLDFSIVPILDFLHKPILWLHLLGFALGVGGATVVDVLFFKFLNDFTISKEENGVLQILSQVIWVGLLVLVISGIGLYLPNAAVLNETPKFLLKTIVVMVIIVNGAFLNLYVSPKLIDISWKAGVALPLKSIFRFRKLSFALGAISFVSWYSAFILGFLKNVPFSLPELLMLYVGILLLAIVGSQIMERFLCKSASTVRN
jgi:uncharacterized membrane protein